MNEPVWFRRTRDRANRFADALERDGSGPRAADADAQEFADELAIAAMLRALGDEPVMDRPARERMRAAVMAGAARMATETATTPAEIPRPRSVPVRVLNGRRAVQRSKASLLAAATAAGIVAFGALGIELAKGALPGDLLYDIKRTTESISLDLTMSDVGKAYKQLEIASTRIDELEALAERDASDGGTTADEVTHYRIALDDFDASATDASRRMTSSGTRSDGSELLALRNWGVESGSRLASIRNTIDSTVLNRFDSSALLVVAIEDRAEILLDRMTCTEVTAGDRDRIGVVPSQSACVDNGRSDVAVLPRASSRTADAADGGKTAGASTGVSEPGLASSTSEPGVAPEGPVPAAPEAPTVSEPADPGEPGVTVPELPEPSAPVLDQDLDRTSQPDVPLSGLTG